VAFPLTGGRRSVVSLLGVALVVAITSGMAAWLLQSSNELTVGGSGLIFGYFGSAGKRRPATMISVGMRPPAVQTLARRPLPFLLLFPLLTS